MPIHRIRSHVNIGNLIFALSFVFSVWLVWYFYTGLGGGLELAARLIPFALALQVLLRYKQGYLYKRCRRWSTMSSSRSTSQSPPMRSCTYCSNMIGSRSTARARSRAGFHRRPAGVPAGDGADASCPSDPILDQCRDGRLYALRLSVSALARLLLASGTTFYRVIMSSTLEFSTGIYGLYGQLALTLIAAFLLLAGVAEGFNAQSAMMNVVRLFIRSRRLIRRPRCWGERDRTDQRQRIGQRRCGRRRHHSLDDSLRFTADHRRRSRDCGGDGWLIDPR